VADLARVIALTMSATMRPSDTSRLFSIVNPCEAWNLSATADDRFDVHERIRSQHYTEPAHRFWGYAILAALAVLTILGIVISAHH